MEKAHQMKIEHLKTFKDEQTENDIIEITEKEIKNKIENLFKEVLGKEKIKGLNKQKTEEVVSQIGEIFFEKYKEVLIENFRKIQISKEDIDINLYKQKLLEIFLGIFEKHIQRTADTIIYKLTYDENETVTDLKEQILKTIGNFLNDISYDINKAVRKELDTEEIRNKAKRTAIRTIEEELFENKRIESTVKKIVKNELSSFHRWKDWEIERIFENNLKLELKGFLYKTYGEIFKSLNFEKEMDEYTMSRLKENATKAIIEEIIDYLSQNDKTPIKKTEIVPIEDSIFLEKDDKNDLLEELKNIKNDVESVKDDVILMSQHNNDKFLKVILQNDELLREIKNLKNLLIEEKREKNEIKENLFDLEKKFNELKTEHEQLKKENDKKIITVLKRKIKPNEKRKKETKRKFWKFF